MKTIKNIIKIVGGLIIVLSTFYYAYSYLSPLFRVEDVDYGDSFHNMPSEGVDVIILGSSHAQYSFNPEFFYEDTGLYSYVLGTPYQQIKVSIEMLKEALKTQSPKLVVLEIYTATYKKETINDSYYVMAQYQMTGEEKRNVIDMLPSDKAKEYRNDFINNHNNWRNIESISSLLEKNDDISPSFGYVQEITPSPISNYWYTRKYEEDVDVEIDEEILNGLNTLYDLCKENDAELMLYIVPVDGFTIEQQSTKNKIWDWANDNNIKYIDFIALDEELDYRMQIHNDGYHSFINGSSVITDYMASFISNNYEFNHIDNEELNKLYLDYIDTYTINVLRTEHNPHKYLNRLRNYPYTIVYSYVGSEINDELNDYISSLGISINGDKLFGIIKNGELISSSDQGVQEEMDGHNITINEYGIYIDDNLVKDSDYFAITIFNEDYSDYVCKQINYLENSIWDRHYDDYYNYYD